jgi:hypothetical protein
MERMPSVIASISVVTSVIPSATANNRLPINALLIPIKPALLFVDVIDAM